MGVTLAPPGEYYRLISVAVAMHFVVPFLQQFVHVFTVTVLRWSMKRKRKPYRERLTDTVARKPSWKQNGK